MKMIDHPSQYVTFNKLWRVVEKVTVVLKLIKCIWTLESMIMYLSKRKNLVQTIPR